MSQLATVDDLNRAIPEACRDAAAAEHVELPVPLHCSNEDEPPCVYLQWRNASVYLYERTAHYINRECKTVEITGDQAERVAKICSEAKKDGVIGYE